MPVAPPRLRRRSVPRLYAIADADALPRGAVPATVGEFADEGVEWVQVRAKGAGDAELCELVSRAQGAAAGTSTRLWVNDRPDVAALYDVAGVHVGQDDLPPGATRRVVGESCWIGRSTHDLEQLAEADVDPEVDVIAFGPVFDTSNKESPDPTVGLERLQEARARTAKPLVAIGGIDEGRVAEVLEAGADSVAVIGAVCRGVARESARRLHEAASAVAHPPLVFLTGFMGAGKSTVGRRLARRLEVGFVDLDESIEQRAGLSIPEIFERHGEEAFRALESRCLSAAARARGAIVATGGGTPVREANRFAMKAFGTVVLLDPELDVLWDRLARSRPGARPLVTTEAAARALWERRRETYLDCDVRIVPTTGSVQRVIADLEARLGQLVR